MLLKEFKNLRQKILDRQPGRLGELDELNLAIN
jgi:hypothetical protein